MKCTKLATILAMVAKFAAAETRQTCVQVKNKSGKPLTDLWVIHQYSNEDKEKHHWDSVPDGGLTNSADMNVTFNTGFGRFGADWWHVNWRHPDDGYKIHFSDPDDGSDGFKKHTLKVQDTAVCAVIQINSDNVVSFTSSSSLSMTKASQMEFNYYNPGWVIVP
ncbi:hypothetical protein QQS21_010784 [Conoideocrella luteorostrata]|uniref:Up-regulated in Daf-2 domain-containing protein n=1 Tax=Conoideocrella luteorostrata TaxID=1105319 RepID=A0AAJ0CEI8_9HYPO|nr:hypothetical protein QQS21_010784 [Conoideocrella luteorostrata]